MGWWGAFFGYGVGLAAFFVIGIGLKRIEKADRRWLVEPRADPLRKAA